MEREPSLATRGSLLLRLRDLGDQQAWEDFVKLYAPMLFEWGLRNGLQESDAAEATQVVLFKLVAAMREFTYDPSQGHFRGWLRTVASNVARDLKRSQRKPGLGSGDSCVLEQLAQISTPSAIEDLANQLERAHRKELLLIAEMRVKLRVKPRNWQAYELLTYEGLSPAVIAKQLSMHVSDVYVAKSRIIKMLRKETEELEFEFS